jgi:hypothetical protein
MYGIMALKMQKVNGKLSRFDFSKENIDMLLESYKNENNKKNDGGDGNSNSGGGKVQENKKLKKLTEPKGVYKSPLVEILKNTRETFLFTDPQEIPDYPSPVLIERLYDKNYGGVENDDDVDNVKMRENAFQKCSRSGIWDY